MFKPNYKNALVSAGISYEDLSEKNKAAYNEVVELEKGYNDLRKSLSKTPSDQQESVQKSIEQIEETLKDLDAEVCKKISKNEFYKQQAIRMADGRKASKTAKNSSDAAASSEKDKSEPGAESETEKQTQLDTSEQAKPAEEIPANTNKETKPAGQTNLTINVDKIKKEAAVKEVKTGKSVEEINDEKEKKKPSAKTVAGWIFGGIATAALTFWGLPIPPINKKAFSLKFKIGK